MNLKDYQDKAKRTESLKDEVVADYYELKAYLDMYVAMTEILDAIKKKVYYSNPKKYNEILAPKLDEIQELTQFVKGYAMSKNADGSTRIGTKKMMNLDKALPINPRVFHGVIGIATESGELMAAMAKAMQLEQPVDGINAQEEMVDAMWYMAILHDALGLNWEDGLERNIAKLRARFPEKYSDERADKRNLSTERKILEGKESGDFDRDPD
jgi:NTP pyrophosphatase (non-canonical NTP hydrolase)